MKNTLFVIFFITLLKVDVFCQSKSKDSVISIVQTDSSFIKNRKKGLTDLFVEKLADSLNRAVDSSDLPFFLKNPDLNYTYQGTYYISGKNMDLRKNIFNKVYNCSILYIIMSDKTGLYKLINSKLIINNNSYYTLAKKRYKKLGCSAR